MEDIPKATDRRQARRYRIVIPVELEHRKGFTRDISASGIFFETELTHPLGATLSFSLVLEHADPGSPVHLQCQGEVVRVEQCGDKVGIAVHFTSYQFDLPGQSCSNLSQSNYLTSHHLRFSARKGSVWGRRKLQVDN